MNKTKLAALFASAALAALAAACGDTAVNVNVNRGGNVAANTAVVTNTNTAPANVAPARPNYNVNMSKEEYEKNKEAYEKERKERGSTIGTGVNDGWLWVKVRGALLAADDLRDSTINVDVDNAVVTLSGTVANGNQKVRAVDVAKKVDGVKSVTNKLTVAAAGGNTNAAAANTANKK